MDKSIMGGFNSFFRPGRQRRRLLMTFLGVLTCGVSVAIFKQAGFGTDPFQCLCNGMDRVIPIDFGTLYTLINLALLIAVFFMDRHYIGIATFVNLFLMGYLIDFTEGILKSLVPAPTMALRIAYLAVAIVVMCVGSSLYFTADLGVPCAGFDGDQADPRNFNEAQYETRVQGLVEAMQIRAEKLEAQA